MSKSSSLIAVFATLLAVGTALDVQARGPGGGGMGGGQGSGQMGGQGGGQGSGDMTRTRTHDAQQSGDMTRTRTRDASQSGDMQQNRELRQEQRRTGQDSIIVTQ